MPWSESECKMNKSPYKELEEKKILVKKSCLCCEREFMSSGPHNRLCYYCRNQKFVDMSDEHGVANW